MSDNARKVKLLVLKQPELSSTSQADSDSEPMNLSVRHGV